ncbi:RHS repeat-associated core domain-containing protein [uncultured Microbulbifer sp.]|uniref:RHS repeat-associated core domain-containing protein n=1 Tax=uncultured Microbulbifer sp. TaxID=348147 RepID=UPI0025F80286|nr:RHS repeat-associated core domain-containing protein [uncultured Microbulbifer sp.]
MNRIHQFLFCFLFLVVSTIANSVPISGTLLPVKSVSVPSNDNDGNYSVVIDSAPETNLEGWIELQEQKDGGSYSSISNFIIGGSSVAVSDRYTAVYRYRAKRCLGFENTRCTAWVYSGNVSVVRTPGRPTAPSSGAKSTNGAINVTWSKPAGVVSDYDLQKRLGSGSWTSAGSDLTGTSKSLTGLSNGNWTFRVRACDEYSGTCSTYSPASGINYVRYKPSTPISPSSGVKSTSGSVPVSWSKPSGSVTYYDLQKRLGSGSWSNAITGTSSTNGSPSLTDGNWTFRVRACNGYSWACSGYSAGSGINYVRRPPSTPAAPSPAAHNTSGSVPVSWSKPSGTVSYYDLQKRLDAGSWSNAITGTSATSGTPGSLAEGNWTFKVRACNEFSWACSAYSSVSSVGYVRFKPSAPVAPSSGAQSTNGSVPVNWSKPSGSVAYYDLQKRLGGGSWSNAITGTSSISGTPSSLGEGDWSFRVRACNDYSWACSSYSPASGINYVRYKPTIPAAPNPESTSTTGSLSVSWSKPSGAVSYYDLQKRLDAGSWANAITGTSSTSGTPGSLVDGNWTFKVRACNEFGWACSAYSTASSIGYVRLKPATPPAPVVPANTTNQSITANFGAAPGGGKYYKLLSRNGASGSFAEHSPGTHVTSVTAVASGLTDGNWYFKVSFCNEFDWACTTSTASNAVNARRLPQSVSLSVPGAVKARNSYEVDFLSSTMVTEWTLKERKVGTSTWNTAYQGGATSKNFTKTVPEESWEYQLTACNTSISCYTTGGASIDITPWVIGDITDAPPTALLVPENDSTVGHLNPGVAVNGGSVNLSIPLVLPPGRARFQPKVSLEYNSTGGNGLLGVGGSIAAGGAISRCADIYDLEGTGGSVTDDTEDKLCLNGERLVLANSSSSYGISGAVYYPETKPQLKVTQSGTLASASFTAEHSNGTVDYYGNHSNSLITRNGVRITWKLRKSQDLHNNSITYEYLAIEGDSLLRNIYYTGNGDILGNRRVFFGYGPRDDIQVSYRNGSRKKIDQRLTLVQTYIGSVRVRDYEIAYHPNTTLSKLKGVTPCGWNSAGTERRCYKETYFEWDNWQSGISSTPLKAVPFTSTVFSGWDEGIGANFDYDGDGTPDLVYSEGHDGFVRLSTTGSAEKLPFASKMDGGSYNQSESFSNSGIDFNGDGRMDHAQLGSSIRFASWDGEQFVTIASNADSECIDWPYNDNPNDPLMNKFRTCSAYSLDLNGDGIQDLITTYQTDRYSVTLKFFRGGGNGSFTYLGSSDSLSIDSPLVITDFDGDGRQELFGRDEGLINYNDSKTLVISTNWDGDDFQSISVDDAGVQVSNSYTPVYFDANQDGLLDVLEFVAGDFEWRLRINTGGDLTSVNYFVGWNDRLQQSSVIPSTGTPVTRFLHSYIRTVDYNRDGVTDLVIPGDIVYPYGCAIPCVGDVDNLKDKLDLYSWKIVFGNKDDKGIISYGNETALPVIAPLTDLNIFDYNGDGYADFVTRFGRKLNGDIAMTGPYANQPGIYVYYNQNSNTDQVSSVTTGLGVKHEFDYAMLHSDDDFYSVTSTVQPFPNINGSTNSNAVKEYRTSDGLGGLTKTTFGYKDALFNLQGRGHQGFREITERKYASASDSQSYAEVVTTFAQEFPQSGSVLTQVTKVRNSSGELVTTGSLVNNLTTVEGQLAATKFVYAETSTTEKSELDGSPISTESVTRVHNYLGLLTGETVTVSDAAGDVTKTVTKDNSFTLDTSVWWFKLDSSSERNQITYTVVPQLPDDALADVTVTKTFEYTDASTRQPTKVTKTSSDTSLNLITTNRYSGPYKQLDRVTLTSNGAGNTAIEGSRWTGMGYSTDGYFVTKTYNSAWGLTVAANDATYDTRTGQPLTQTDANGHTTTNQYDHFGQLIESDAPGVPVQKLSRQLCSAGCPVAATSRKAVYFEIAAQAGAPLNVSYYDVLGREVYRETEGANGTIVQWQSYDSRGRVTQVADPHYVSATNGYGIVDFTEFDGLNRPIAKTVQRLPISYDVAYDYSGLGTDITVTPNALGPVLMMASRSSVLGQPLYHQDAKGQHTYFRYDALGNVAMIQDVAGNAITATYNGFGHKLGLSDPNMGNWQFSYNALGELRWQKDAKSQVTTFNYDALGRLRHQYPGSDAAHHFQFDASAYGTLDREYTGSSTNPAFERIYEYDSLQREIARTTQIDGRVFVQKTAWDTNYGRIKGLSYPGGTIVETRYDETGRVAEDWDFAAGIKLRSVDNRSATEAILQQSFANALIEETNYNAAGLIEQRCVSSLIGNCSKSKLIYDEYDSYGNLNHRENAIAGVEESFTYDNLHRLTQSSRSWNGYVPTTLHSTVDYDYDAAGNLLYKTDFSSGSLSAYQYGDASRSTGNAGPNAVTQVQLKDLSTRSYAYDLNGNLTADGLRSISYGVNNKPRSISHSNGNSATFYYGSDNSRYKQVATNGSATTTRYYLGAYEYEQTVQGGNTTVVERTAVGDFAQYRTQTLNGSAEFTGWEFLHKDHLGSIESVSDIAGAIKERRGFDPFGKARDLREDDSNGGLLGRATTKRGFTDHEHLDGVELIHMNGRAYDYNLGRFLSVDPFISMPENSQAYNPYSYVMNNPLRYTDPTGYLVNLPETNISVSDETARDVQSQIDNCNSSRCGGVAVTLSDGTIVVYLKGNGNGGGKIGAVAVNSPRERTDRNGANSVASGQSSEEKHLGILSRETASGAQEGLTVSSSLIALGTAEAKMLQESNQVLLDGDRVRSLHYYGNQFDSAELVKAAKEGQLKLVRISQAAGGAGYVLTAVNISTDAYQFRTGELSTGRYVYRHTGNTIAIGLAVVGSGGWAAVVGLGFFGGEKLYDHAIVPGARVVRQEVRKMDQVIERGNGAELVTFGRELNLNNLFGGDR